jgi:Fe-S cluster assembly ATPase SufC
MASEITLIHGPVQSGKTYLATLIAGSQTCKIWDEPVVNKKFLKEIKLFTAYHGRAIITCVDPTEILKKVKVDWAIQTSKL